MNLTNLLPEIMDVAASTVSSLQRSSQGRRQTSVIAAGTKHAIVTTHRADFADGSEDGAPMVGRRRCAIRSGG